MPQRRRKMLPPPIEDIDPHAPKRACFSRVFPDIALSIASNLHSIPAFCQICMPYGLVLGQETRASSSVHGSMHGRGNPRVQQNLISIQPNVTRIQVLKEMIDAAQAELRDLQTIDLTLDEETD
ncbi:hypothetical protein EWM64_g9714 [Hericium alpestre]|uniref:Uncharacterized protein n=1 Tax=Hericium alpestre TaxID=135208 RepID=A0A4Y9ZL89_9AGAM|nr:hypothetical protein EWM64_g9714 [Hericium alpestre]